jgi:hypothetical protein
MKNIVRNIIVLLFLIPNTTVCAQSILGRLKKKAGDIAEKVIDQKTDDLLNGEASGKNGDSSSKIKNQNKKKVKTKSFDFCGVIKFCLRRIFQKMI